MQLVFFAGNSSSGPTAGSSAQADILMVYAASEGKRMGHQETLLHRGLHPGWTSGVALGAARAWRLGHRGTNPIAVRPSSFHVYYL